MRSIYRALALALVSYGLAFGQSVSGGGGSGNVADGGTNGGVYRDSTGGLHATATGGAGTLCFVSANGGTPTWGSCAGSAATAWDSLTAPSGNLAITMSTNLTAFTWAGNTSTSNLFSLKDTTGNTGTGSIFEAHSVGTSVAKPVTFTAQGTANGVQMSSAGALAKIGTGSIAADTVTGFSPAASKTLTLSNTLTFVGTDGNSFTFPSGSDTVVTLGATQTLTAKTLTTPTIASFTNATHTHANAAGGGQLNPTTALSATGTPSSTTFLRGDNTWAAPSGTGTVTVVGSGNLTSTACVTGGGSQTIQTPSATCTIDSSGNISTPGTLTTGVGGGVAGSDDMGAGTPATVAANAFGWGAGATMTTSVRLISPNAVPAANQAMLFGAPNGSNIATWAWTGISGTGSFAMTASPTFTGTITGAAETLSGAFTNNGSYAGSAVLPVANGGTNCSSATIACFNNITGFTAAGTTGTTSTSLVFSTSPTLVTPTLGAATVTTVNKVTITAPASAATLTIPDGVTMTGPAASGTVATLGNTNTLTGRQDATGAASTAPAKTGTSLPGTCIVGDLYFKSDATAGQNIYECQSTNTWTQQLNSGGSGGGSAGSPLFTYVNATGTGPNNTGTETSLIGTATTGSKTISANVMVAGTMLQSVTTGSITTPAVPDNLTINMYMGATKVATGTITGTNIASLTGQSFALKVNAFVLTGGATCALVIQDMTLITATVVTGDLVKFQGTGTTFDCTATQAFDVKAQWATIGQSGESIVGQGVGLTIPGTLVSSVNSKVGAVALTLNSSDFANEGTTTTVLHGAAAGNPSFGAVVSADLNITATTCTAPQVLTAISAGGVGTCTAPLLTQNSQSTAYTTVLGDAGKQIYHPGADTTARTWTIDSNANVAYSIGTCITFINDTSAGTLTIAITSDTMILAGAGTTGSRTLTASNVATACKMTSTRWIISGSSGLT